MQEQNNNSEFNFEKLHQQFDELWKTADSLEVESFQYLESYAKVCFMLDKQKAFILHRAICLCSFKAVPCNSIEFNDETLDCIWITFSIYIEHGVEYFDNCEDEDVEPCEGCSNGVCNGFCEVE
jgi:hypothetical protein